MLEYGRGIMDGGTRKSRDQVAESAIRDDLHDADAMIDAAGPMMRHLLANDDRSLFSDETVARVRGMCRDLAIQLLFALAEAAGEEDRETFAYAHGRRVEDALCQQSALLSHIHGLALEWQLGERLQRQHGFDPVVSPLLQSLIASSEAATAAAAMGALAAQARFIQQQRRMELPLRELPGDLFHIAIATMRLHAADLPDEIIAAAEARLKETFDEAAGRLGLMSRLVTGMRGGVIAALSIAHAGSALYLTALSAASGQSRELTTLSVNQGNAVRHALALLASGVKPKDAMNQLETVCNDTLLPAGLDQIDAERAAALLATSAPGRMS